MNRRTLMMGAGLATVWASCGRAANGPSSAENPPLAKNDAEKRVLGVLDEMAESGKTYLSVPTDDGRWLRVLAEAAGAKHVVEVGTSTGYSGLWLSLALLGTGGKLTTLEIDAERAETARSHFRQAGVDRLVTVIVGDAHEEVTKLKGPLDVAFIDADKEGYPHYLTTLQPLVRPGGLILAHNVGMSKQYEQAVTTDPQLETVFYMGGNQLSVTLKKL